MYNPHSGRFVKEDNSNVNLADMAIGTDKQAIVTRSKLNDFLEKGYVYACSNLFLAVPNNSTAQFIINVGANDILSVGLDVSSTGKGIARIYRAPVYTGGTTVPSYNRKNDSANTPLSTIIHTPTTLTSSGTLVYTDLIAGSGAGNNKVGGFADNGAVDALLAKNTKTLFEITNNSGSASDIAVQFFFIEPF